MLLQHLEATGAKLPHLRRVVIGGSACPRAMTKAFQELYGVEVCHAWGMTEMSPLGSIGSLKPEIRQARHRRTSRRAGEAGPPAVWGRDEDDRRCRPGVAARRQDVRPAEGARCRRRPRLFQGGETILDGDDFFDTGDVAPIDRYGYMRITDRSKDVIKSGGEWISSIELENLAVGHPKVAEAAVIGVRHPKWDERPLLVVVLKKDQTASREDILGFMRGKVANWWMPDDVAFVDEIPHTATGKILKTELRSRFKDYVLPSVAA